MRKFFTGILSLLLVVVLVGACINKSTVSTEQEVVTDTIQVDSIQAEETVDSLVEAIQAEADAINQLTKELE